MSLDQKLVGVWTTRSKDDQTEFTYTKHHLYVKRWGRQGFSTGAYEEKGEWDIFDGDKIELIPEDRKNGVAGTDREFTKKVIQYEKEMDEGTWKPVPMEATFTSADSFVESTELVKSMKPVHYQRVSRT